MEMIIVNNNPSPGQEKKDKLSQNYNQTK